MLLWHALLLELGRVRLGGLFGRGCSLLGRLLQRIEGVRRANALATDVLCSKTHLCKPKRGDKSAVLGNSCGLTSSVSLLTTLVLFGHAHALSLVVLVGHGCKLEERKRRAMQEAEGGIEELPDLLREELTSTAWYANCRIGTVTGFLLLHPHDENARR